ncbi:unnamed protein product [Protopolystoma xenopodis]|uniref:Uncharacterized protein n=1 Tax=Protopolystoma xenopodis TaxID=117903 RepID=A0A448WPC8_9PLAT|nr:unnamed protein product [Protopolystoma xenopodis]
MSYSFDDVHHMMDKTSARIQAKRWVRFCGPRQPERRIKSKWLQYNGIQPSSSGEIDLTFLIPTLSREMKVSSAMVYQEIARNPITLPIYNIGLG